jgi:hypothetical protein
MDGDSVQIAIRQSKALDISDVESYKSGEAYLRVLSDLIKNIKDWFKPQKQKIDAAKKEILGKEREMLGPVEEEKAALRAKMSAWYAEQEKARIAETERLKETAADPSLVSAPRLDVGTQKRVWKFRVVNFAKLPDAYKLTNEAALRSEVSSGGGKTDIPGIEVYLDYITVTR